jgi:hypothetical protein
MQLDLKVSSIFPDSTGSAGTSSSSYSLSEAMIVYRLFREDCYRMFCCPRSFTEAADKELAPPLSQYLPNA